MTKITDKKAAAHELITRASECNKKIKVSEVTKLVIQAFAMCETQSEPWKEHVKLDGMELHNKMMVEFAHSFFPNLLLEVDPKLGLDAIFQACKEGGEVGITMLVKEGNKA